MGTAPARARRGATLNRTRAIVGGSSAAAFLAILTAVGIHGGSQPASNAGTTNAGSTPNSDAGGVQPNDQAHLSRPFDGSSDSGTTNPYPRRFSGGGFSATPGAGGASPNTRSHGS